MSRNTGWFRIYERMIDSPQVLELNDTEFRLLVSVWCLASAQAPRGVVPFSPRALQRRMLPDHNVEDVERMLAHLMDLNLLTASPNGGFTIVNWDEHQGYRDDGRPPLSEWRELRSAVFARDDYTCQYCGARGVSLQCDHIIPVSRGGSNDLANLTTACRPCNQSKYNKLVEEWRI